MGSDGILWVRTPAEDYEEIFTTEYQDEDWDAICGVHDAVRPDELKGSCDPYAFVPIKEDPEVEELVASEKWVAVDGEDLVGFVSVDKQYLAWLYIHPNYYKKALVAGYCKRQWLN